tara:strand:- start:1687 stop:1875 length:189 start_codon:yes stop_codon:yes gene_type:complete
MSFSVALSPAHFQALKEHLVDEYGYMSAYLNNLTIHQVCEEIRNRDDIDFIKLLDQTNPLIP